MQMGFLIETDKCIRCYGCQVACKNVNNIEPGPQWRRVLDVWGGTYPNVTRKIISVSCMHCAKPACAAMCPTGAISKRFEDGIVVVDQSKCIGCHYCFYACPFGVPQYGTDGTMQKCDLCLSRLEKGQQPACVATCPTGAIHVGTMEELAVLAAEKTAENIAGSTQPSVVVSASKQ